MTINVFISISVGLNRDISIGDLEEAFLQGNWIKRFLLVDQPPGGVPGLQPGQSLRPEVEVHDTVREHTCDLCGKAPPPRGCAAPPQLLTRSLPPQAFLESSALAIHKKWTHGVEAQA